jgi:hypothetical protein
MRVGASYSDVCIRDISSRGMMLQAATPPAKGTYIEILRAAHIVVARVVWVNERRFGIVASDRMDVAAVINAAAPAGSRNDGQERRSTHRQRMPAPTANGLAQRAERSRRLSRAFQFGMITLSGMVGAGLLGGIAYDAMASPFKHVAAHLTAR